MNGKNEDGRILSSDRSIAFDCCFPYGDFPKFLEKTRGIAQIDANKIDAISGGVGWENWIRLSREETPERKIIYDGQKLGRDVKHIIPGLVEEFKRVGFDAIIVYPKSDEILGIYAEETRRRNLGIIVGGKMTNEKNNDEESYLFYLNAIRMGVTNFGIPASGRSDYRFVENLMEIINKTGKHTEFDWYPIGIGPQGGTIEEVVETLGENARFHVIMGRTIYDAPNVRQAALHFVSKLS
jgi:hypothetical protein